MTALPNFTLDPTLEAMHKAVEALKAKEPPRNYLGASIVGDPCDRKIWYGYNHYPRKPIEYKGCYAIEDGHRSEDLIASRLRLVPGVEVHTHDENGDQYGFLIDKIIGGHIDGVITGLLQAPTNPHLWENKAVNETKFGKIKKLVDEFGEKNALQKWDIVYYAQAQMYMGRSPEFLGRQFDRHYTTICTPGGRDVTSCRTEFQPLVYEALLVKGMRIAKTKTAPVRISDDPAYFHCKFCEFRDTCHA